MPLPQGKRLQEKIQTMWSLQKHQAWKMRRHWRWRKKQWANIELTSHLQQLPFHLLCRSSHPDSHSDQLQPRQSWKEDWTSYCSAPTGRVLCVVLEGRASLRVSFVRVCGGRNVKKGGWVSVGVILIVQVEVDAKDAFGAIKQCKSTRRGLAVKSCMAYKA